MLRKKKGGEKMSYFLFIQLPATIKLVSWGKSPYAFIN